MKRKLKWFFIIVLTISFGWVIGYLRIPYTESSSQFWVGCFAGLVIVFLGFLVLKVWKNYNVVNRWLEDGKVSDGLIRKKYNSMWLFVAGTILVSGISVAGALIIQTKVLKTHMLFQDKRIHDLVEMTDALSKRSHINAMSNVLNKVDEEIQRKPNGPISDATIARLAALSFSLKPYKYFVADTLCDRSLSPERGQLLLALALMPIDSNSFARIKYAVTFAHADLRNVDLSNKDLSGINLEAADLSNAELSGINFNRAKLRDISLTGAVMNRSSINYSDLRSSNLKWVQLNESEMKYSNFFGANLSNAQLMRSDLSESTFILADLSFSILVTSILHKTDFAHCNLNMSDLSNCDLSGGRLIKASILKCNMTGLNLNMVEVSSHWLNNLKNDEVGGINSIIDGYSLLDSISNSSIKYYLSEL